jgi:hypothetical protein
MWSERVPAEAEVDVDARGFLPHRTRLFAALTTNQIELWPAANDAEAEAIRAMVFDRDRLRRFQWWSGYYLTLVTDGLPRTHDEIAKDWTYEYGEIQALTGLLLSLSFTVRGNTSDQYEEEVIVLFDGTQEMCSNPWEFCGFWNNSFPYYSRPYRVNRASASRPDVIRRILAHGLLNANPLPGLLNKTAPAAELSLLEKQTLRMQFKRGPETFWPDRAASR